MYDEEVLDQMYDKNVLDQMNDEEGDKKTSIRYRARDDVQVSVIFLCSLHTYIYIYIYIYI